MLATDVESDAFAMETLKQAVILARSGQIVEAVRYYRSVAGCSLREANDIVRAAM